MACTIERYGFSVKFKENQLNIQKENLEKTFFHILVILIIFNFFLQKALMLSILFNTFRFPSLIKLIVNTIIYLYNDASLHINSTCKEVKTFSLDLYQII